MIRALVLLWLLTGAAMAQTSYHWVDSNLGWTHRLLNGTQWTPFVIGEDRAKGVFTLYQAGAPVASGTDIAALKARAVTMAGQ